MKKSELKEILKPLIKECIRESIFEEGVLSMIIAEVMSGTNQGSVITEEKTTEKKVLVEQEERQARQNDYKKKIRETKKQMLDAIGNESYNGVNLFEGTDPLTIGGSVGSSPSPPSPLSNYAPTDAGVDISSIFSSKWKDLV